MEKTTTSNQFAGVSSSPSSASLSGDSATLRSVNQAGNSLHDTIDRVAEPARSGVDRAATAAHSTLDKLASGANTMAGKMSEQAHRLNEAQMQAMDYSKAYIKDHPLQAVGAALVAGLILGRLTAPRY